MSMTIWLRLMASFLWIFTAGSVLVKNNRSARILYRLDVLAQTGLFAVLAVLASNSGLWVSAALVLVVKGAGVPGVMRRGSYAVERDYSAQGKFGMSFVLALTVALTVMGFYLGQQLNVRHPVTIGILWAAWLVGFLHLTLRYEIWSEAWALLNFEIITSALAVLLLTQFPLVSDILTDGVAVAMALLLSVFMALMRTQYGSSDVRKAGELQG